MTWPDFVNGTFESLAGVSQFWNCWCLARDKKVAGVDWRVTFFFIVWGVWNLYYYPHLNQWWSFLGGVAIVLANLLWVCMAVYFKHESK
jgi:hypothetical protein